ncbi:MAG: radical SAM family heme chaperone HemW [Clostridium sp.]|nr:radical SAM family heme chaperone HemW [Clostridium sp.]
MTGIYIHVPFCAKKCPYCDFYSCSYSKKTALEYQNAVLRNINYLPEIEADTVYFGGGTPSLMSEQFFGSVLNALNNKVKLTDPEITIEVNPCTVTHLKLKQYKFIGINRISFGVQSADNNELEFLERLHTFEMTEKVVNDAFDAGFENISCDIMIGTKDQTLDKLEYSINKIASLPITHISSYILKIEENTPFAERNIRGMLPDDELTAYLYLRSVELIESAGFRQYEISNFSKKDFESRHNLKYWQCEEYIGIGPAAHSFYNGKRYFVPKDIEAFCNDVCQKTVYENYTAGTDEEKIMLGLRLTNGIFLDDFPERKNDIVKKAEKYCQNGFAFIENGYLKLTPKGFLVSNSIISDII